MATLNAAECFDLKDRGAIAPGYRGDVVLLDDLKDFHVNRVFVEGTLVAEEGKYLPEIKKCDISSVKGSVIVKDFSKEKFKNEFETNKVNDNQDSSGWSCNRRKIQQRLSWMQMESS